MGNPIACTRACVSFALAAVICLASFGIARAQSVFDVTGSVTATDGTPVAGASVVLTAHGVSHRAQSDAHGSFTVGSVSGGTYALDASAPGYEAISQRTVTIDAANSTLRIALSRATTNSLTVIGTVQASAGETVSTASAPSVTLNAQRCRRGRRLVGGLDGLAAALGYSGDSTGRRKQRDRKCLPFVGRTRPRRSSTSTGIK